MEYIINTTNMPDHILEVAAPWCNAEVIRCRDCRFAYNRAEQAKDYGVDTEPDYVCDLLCCIKVEPDGFCKWGEESDPGRSRPSDSAGRTDTEPHHMDEYSAED